jgi:hypothetical protein
MHWKKVNAFNERQKTRSADKYKYKKVFEHKKGKQGSGYNIDNIGLEQVVSLKSVRS